MKQFFSMAITMAVAVLLSVSCHNVEDDFSWDTAHIRVVEPIEEIPMGHEHVYNNNFIIPTQFRTLDFDKAHIFRSLDDYKTVVVDADPLFVDSLVASTVDFETSSIVAIPGFAAAPIENIEYTLKEADGRYRLDVNIIVTDTATVITRWNMLLKTPRLKSENIETFISTNRPITNEPPTHYNTHYLYATSDKYSPKKYEPTPWKGAYKIYYNIADIERVYEALKNDTLCRISVNTMEHTIAQRNRFDRAYWGDDVYCSYLQNCDYDNVVKPIEDIVVYCSQAVSFPPPMVNYGDTYDYIMPYLSGIASYDNGGAKPHLDKVLEYFGGEKFYAETTFISYDHTRFHGINVIEALRLAFGYYFESMVYDVQRSNNTYAYKDAMQMVGRE